MAGKNLNLLDGLRAIAWCRDVMEASGRSIEHLMTNPLAAHRDRVITKKESARLLAVEVNMSSGAKPKSFAKEEWRWDYYADGKRLPDDETVAVVEAFYPGTAQVFTAGPDGLPLWSVLAKRSSQRKWMNAVDGWLITPARHASDEMRYLAARSAEFSVKAEKAWKRLVPGNAPVDFLDYARGHQPNIVSRPMREFLQHEEWLKRKADRKTQAAPQGTPTTITDQEHLAVLRETAVGTLALEDVVPVLALWRLAEAKGEKRSEARYLARGVLPWVPYVLAPWGIGDLVAPYLDQLVPFPDPGADLRSDAALRHQE
jgi:hypothetical protein